MKILLAPVGALSGICAAMGIGGGFVLLLYFALFGSLLPEETRLFNLLFFLPIAAIALLRHRKSGLIDKKAAIPAILGGIPGAVLGVFCSGILPQEMLTKIFAVFLLFYGIKTLFRKKTSKGRDQMTSALTR